MLYYLKLVGKQKMYFPLIIEETLLIKYKTKLLLPQFLLPRKVVYKKVSFPVFIFCIKKFRLQAIPVPSCFRTFILQ